MSGLLKALQFEHSDASLKNLVRELAADRLGTMGEAAREAIPSLSRSARTDDDYGVRPRATCALAAIR